MEIMRLYNFYALTIFIMEIFNYVNNGICANTSGEIECIIAVSMHQLARVLIILTMIVIWWARVDSGKSARMVDCEKYVFHPHCRGTQAKKRIIPTVINDGKADKVCMCKSAGLGSNYGGRGRNLIVNSKLLESMLSHGFDVDTIYDAYLTYLSSSSSSMKNKDDELSQRNSISSNSNSRGSSSISSSNNRHHGEQSGNEERVRLPFSDNPIHFTNSDIDLDYPS